MLGKWLLVAHNVPRIGEGAEFEIPQLQFFPAVDFRFTDER